MFLTAALLKMRLRQRFFSMNFTKILRIKFFIEHRWMITCEPLTRSHHKNHFARSLCKAFDQQRSTLPIFVQKKVDNILIYLEKMKVFNFKTLKNFNITTYFYSDKVLEGNKHKFLKNRVWPV